MAGGRHGRLMPFWIFIVVPGLAFRTLTVNMPKHMILDDHHVSTTEDTQPGIHVVSP